MNGLPEELDGNVDIRLFLFVARICFLAKAAAFIFSFELTENRHHIVKLQGSDISLVSQSSSRIVRIVRREEEDFHQSFPRREEG